MEIDFEKLMSTKSDEGLQDYIDRRTKFVPEAVEAAIAEMQKRGKVFSGEELSNIHRDLQGAKAQEEQGRETSLSPWFSKWRKNVVKDLDAPVYYSPAAIYILSGLFTVLCGAILLAINCRKSSSKKGAWLVIGYAVIFMTLQFWILSMLPRNNPGLTMISSCIGAVIMNQFFWDRFIGRDTKFRARPVWIPVIIASVICILFILIALMGRADR